MNKIYEKIFISVAQNPGTTGFNFFNSLFKLLKLNYFYVPFKLDDIAIIREIIKKLNISGCSVSTPYKKTVTKYVDYLDAYAEKTKMINTILYKKKKLYGFNTDFYALIKILSKIIKNDKQNIILLGNGAIAYCIYLILKNKRNIFYLSARNLNKYKKWKVKKKLLINWKNRANKKFDILINATSIGLKDPNEIPVPINKINQFKFIFDVVVNDKSKLKIEAKKKNINFIGGKEMSFYQGCKQFEIYTGIKFNQNKIKKYLNYKFK